MVDRKYKVNRGKLSWIYVFISSYYNEYLTQLYNKHAI